MTARRGRRGQKISACDSCWKRKIKCNATVPTCFWCEHYKIPCVYKREDIRRRRAIQASTSQTESRDVSPHNESMSSTIEYDDSEMHVYSQPTLPICSLMRISDSSALHQEWSRFKAGQLVSTERLCRDRFGQSSLSPLPFLPSLRNNTESDMMDAVVLPDRALLERCARLYMRSTIRATFPILDPYLFDESVRLAYDPNDHEPSHIMSAKACVIAFSIFSYLVPFGIRLCSTSKFNYYNALLQQLLPIITEAATLDGFQACVFLLLSQFFTGRLKSAAVTNSIAAHFVFYLGAHNEWSTQPFNHKQHNSPSCVRTHLRNLFWACYTIDKNLCFRAHQPPALIDNHCDLNVSLLYMERISKQFATGLPFDKFHPSIMFPTDIKLSQIKSRAYESLHSMAAFRKPNMELLMDIQDLDNSLETWRLAIPKNYRPSLSFSYGMEVDSGNTDIRTLILRLDYLYCVTAIHRASNRCLGTSMSSDGIESAIATSIALAVEASRSTLRYLQAAYHITSEGSFWLIIFYLLTASVTISCNIIDNPALSSAVHDYELLKDIPGLMYHMSTHDTEPEERLHKDHLRSFIKDLIDAAEFAISSIRDGTPSLQNDDQINMDIHDGLSF